MAPISTLNTIASPFGHSDIDHSLMSFDLPISRRGHFFQDSFFENAQEQFNSTVRRILQRWGETDFLGKQWDDPKLSLSDSLSRYRQLRTHNLKEEDQAVTVTSDATTHKIVMDVHDFVGGEVKVKVAGESEVVVEGRTETKDGDWSMSSNSFRRRFCLPPNTDVKAVSAVLSDDGVLTISAPRTAPALESGHMEVPITREGTQATTASKVASSLSKTTEATSSTSAHQQQTQTQTTATQGAQGHIIPIQVDSSDEPQSPAPSQTFTSQMDQQPQVQKNERMESAIKNISDTIRRAQHSSVESITASSASPRPLFTPPTLRGRNIPITPSSFLPISKKGSFFNDDFFANMREDFQSAVNDVLGRWGEGSVLGGGHDALTSLNRYRQLRERNLGVESQAVNVSADQTSHKIVMDVKDFVSGEVKVKVAGGREVVVEGRTETKDGDWSVSTNSFRRRFCLPLNTDVKALSAVVSDDGVLTITAPKKVTTVPGGSTIPIQVDGSKDIKIEPATPSTPGTPATPVTPASATPVTHSLPQTQSSLPSTQTDARVSGSVGTFAKESSSTQQTQTSSLTSHQPSSPTSPGGLMLPITTRGLFFGDSFFKNTWQDFHEAVRDVVSKWGNFSADEDLTRYKDIRALDVKNENQAVKSTEDEANYKIVVDVQGFTKGGNITVRAVRDRELVVEGHVEQQEGGAKYRKQFHRRFVLPQDIYPESVSSVMSADGVLTITAPKKPSSIQLKELIIPVAIEEGLNKTESLSHMPTPDLTSPVASPVTTKPLPFSPIPPASPATSYLSDTTTTSMHQQATSHSVTSESNQQVGGPREHIIPMSLEDSRPSPSAVTQCTQAHKTEASQAVSQTQAAATSEAQLKQTAATETLQKEGSSNMKMVPISQRGAFYSDSFFEDARKRFAALTQEQSSLTSSHSLLRRNFRLKEQEAHVEEDTQALKITLDVNDFIGGEVKVAVKDGRALVVEGQTSCEEGTSSSSRSFRRVFSLPSNADVAAVTSALSSDGVLTIFAPKLQQLAETAAGNRELKTESHSRQETQGAGTRGWEESKVKEEVKETNGSSTKSYSSSYASQQHFSS